MKATTLSSIKSKLAIIKVGTNILTTDKGNLDLNNLRSIIHQVSNEVQNRKLVPIIVSSASITCGAECLNFNAKTLPDKQAAAAVGQVLLMHEYATFFGFRGHNVGQILLTKEGLKRSVARTNITNTIFTLLKRGVIPVINENDSVATHEIELKFGDNDELSSLVAELVQPKLLLILTDTDGLYDKNPRVHSDAKLIPHVPKITPAVLRLASDDSASPRSRGGMKSKLLAAQRATNCGVKVVVANGRDPDILHKVFNSDPVGTTFDPQ